MPVSDCYYIAKEAEAGDPLLVDNPAETTTDSEDYSWDKATLARTRTLR